MIKKGVSPVQEQGSIYDWPVPVTVIFWRIWKVKLFAVIVQIWNPTLSCDLTFISKIIPRTKTVPWTSNNDEKELKILLFFYTYDSWSTVQFFIKVTPSGDLQMCRGKCLQFGKTFKCGNFRSALRSADTCKSFGASNFSCMWAWLRL